MAQMELDSFVIKLKSLWLAGLSAKLNIETEGGKVSVRLEADLGYAPPPSNKAVGQRRGPSYRRRQERRRAQDSNIATVDTLETHAVSDAQNTTEVTEQVNSEVDQSMTDQEDLELKELRSKIAELEQEIQLKTNTIAVNDMLFEDFKERVKIKYLYDSNDDESDYEPDEEKRELMRWEFWQKKLEERFNQKGVPNKSLLRPRCKECDFIAKCEQGLKTHTRRKH